MHLPRINVSCPNNLNFMREKEIVYYGELEVISGTMTMLVQRKNARTSPLALTLEPLFPLQPDSPNQFSPHTWKTAASVTLPITLTTTVCGALSGRRFACVLHHTARSCSRLFFQSKSHRCWRTTRRPFNIANASNERMRMSA